MDKIITEQIKDHILVLYDYTREEVENMTLWHQMSLINMRDIDKWEEFKIGLRNTGFII